ncbi:MAG: hypothetical protein U0736_22655 [Gemmataceae bacterium]
MSVDVLDRLQESKRGWLEELLDASQPAAGVIGSKDEAAAIADLLVDEGIGLRHVSLRAWDCHWSMALAGTVPDRQERGARLRTLLHRVGQTLSRVATVARHYATASGHEVARLAAFEEQARTFPVWVEERMACWEMLGQPRPLMDREAVARAREAYHRGECESTGDLLARLRRGESITGE